MEYVPVDVLRLVFKFLRLPDVLCCRLVCKEWCEVADCNSVWLHFLQQEGWASPAATITSKSIKHECMSIYRDSWKCVREGVSVYGERASISIENPSFPFCIVRGIATIPRTTMLACGTDDNSIYIVDPRETGKHPRKVDFHRYEVTSLVAGQEHIFSASRDGNICRWNYDPIDAIRSPYVFHYNGAVLSMSPVRRSDGLLLTGGIDCIVRLLDLEHIENNPETAEWAEGNAAMEGGRGCVYGMHSTSLYSMGGVMCMDSDTTRVVSGAMDGSVGLWDIETAMPVLPGAHQNLSDGPGGVRIGHGTSQVADSCVRGVYIDMETVGSACADGTLSWIDTRVSSAPYAQYRPTVPIELSAMTRLDTYRIICGHRDGLSLVDARMRHLVNEVSAPSVTFLGPSPSTADGWLAPRIDWISAHHNGKHAELRLKA